MNLVKLGSTTTRFIYGNGELLATVEGNGTATSTRYYHSDHLGSTRLVTDSTGVGKQALDYYPYSVPRTDNGPYDGDRTYIGEMYDPETSLSYLNARYYEGNRGQFLSQDPVFWEVAQTQDGIAVLRNPQAQNSYSYAQNNPLVYKDPSGRVSTNANYTYTTPVYGVPLGPTFGVYSNGNDPILYFGIAVADKPGPSGSLTISAGSPSEGFDSSLNAFTRRFLGGAVSLISGETPEIGVGTQGFGGSVTIGIKVSRIASLGGPAEYITTPSMNVQPTPTREETISLPRNSNTNYSSSGSSKKKSSEPTKTQLKTMESQINQIKRILSDMKSRYGLP